MANQPEVPVWIDEISLLPAPLRPDPVARAIEHAAMRLQALDLDPLLVYDIATVDASALPALAWQFSLMDEPAWALAESEDRRRALIASAIELHAHKGTPFAIRELARLLGFGEVEITEGYAALFLDGTWLLDGSQQLGAGPEYWTLDGSVLLNGSQFLGGEGSWAKYSLRMASAITNDQAALLRDALAGVAPARCHLVDFNYTEAAFRLDGSVLLDGSFNLGTSNG